MPESAPPPIVEVVSSGRVLLKDISSRAWEHPDDRAALMALRAVPGFDLIVRKLFGLFSERALRFLHLANAVEVGPRQFPKINAVYEEVLSVLDAPDRYTLFVSQNPVVNAGAVGWDSPFIVLNSATVHLLDEDQLRVVLGHELGHILSQHVLYKTVLRLLLRASSYAFSLPITGVALMGVMMALLAWDRRSELSADRAAALVAQDPEHVRTALLRLAGGVGEGASVEAFREQAARYEENESALDIGMKTLALLGRSHPFPVHRLKELDLWVNSGELDRVLRGEYPRRQDDPKESWWTAAKESASQASDSFRSSADPVAQWFRDGFRDAGDSVSSQARSAFQWFKKPKGGKSEEPPAESADDKDDTDQT